MEILLQKIRRTNRQKGFNEVESLLQATLTPVAPRTVYVNDLKSRLIHHKPSGLKLEKPGQRNNLLLLLASIVSSALLIITGIRMIFILIALLSGLRQGKRQLPRKTVASTPAA